MKENIQCLSFSVWFILINMMTTIVSKTESHRGELPSKVVHSKNLGLIVELLLNYHLKVHF